jgi:hypothetical protein
LENIEGLTTSSPHVRRCNTAGFDTDEPLDDALLIFLLDFIENSGGKSSFAWLGARQELFDRFAEIIQTSHPTSDLVFIDASSEWFRMKSFVPQVLNSDYFIIDNRVICDESVRVRNQVQAKLGKFFMFIFFRQKRGHKPRVVGINFVNTAQARLFRALVSARVTPYVLGYLVGDLRTRSPQNFLSVLRALVWSEVVSLLRRELSDHQLEALLRLKHGITRQ